MRLEAGQAALDIPELLKSDIRSETGFRYMIIKEFQSQPVSDNGRLSDRNIGKWACVDEARLVLYRIAEGRIDGIAHPGRHGTGNFQILCGDRISLFVIGKNDLADTLTKVLQIRCNCKDRHQFGRHCDIRACPHPVAHHLAFAKADLHITESLAAEVHYEIPLDSLRIDVQTFDTDLCKTLVIIIALMLHSRIQCDHAKIVRIGNIIDIPCKSQ